MLPYNSIVIEKKNLLFSHVCILILHFAWLLSYTQVDFAVRGAVEEDVRILRTATGPPTTLWRRRSDILLALMSLHKENLRRLTLQLSDVGCTIDPDVELLPRGLTQRPYYIHRVIEALKWEFAAPFFIRTTSVVNHCRSCNCNRLQVPSLDRAPQHRSLSQCRAAINQSTFSWPRTGEAAC